MTEPTEADRAKAAEVVREWGETPGMTVRDASASALADERAAAFADLRARVEAVAEEYESIANDHFAAGHREKAYDALEHAARIRAAVSDTTGGTQ